MKYPKFKVCVRCLTYNQSKYITDTLNGFCMQKTKYPFVCCIIDDASKDGEQEIISTYIKENFLYDSELIELFETDSAKIIYTQHKENSNCFITAVFLKKNLYHIPGGDEKKRAIIDPWFKMSEYVALCEGDDYWIDETKLQKQVDILDSNSNISLVYTDYLTVDEEGRKIDRIQYKKLKAKSKSGSCLRPLLTGNFIMTLTTCFRKEVLNKTYKQAPYALDYAFLLNASLLGDFSYVDMVTGAYRKVGSSLMNANLSVVKKKSKEVHDYFVIEYLKRFRHTQSGFNRFLLENEILINALFLYFKRIDTSLIIRILKTAPQLTLSLPIAIVQGLIGRYIYKKNYLVGL